MKAKSALLLLAFLTMTLSVFSQSSADRVRQLAQNKDFEEARAYLPKAMEEKWKDPEFLLLAGDIYTELNNLDSALIAYRKSNEQAPNKPPTLRRIGKTLSLLNKHSEAIDVLKKLADKEKTTDNNLELADAHIRAGQIQEAQVLITKTREQDKKNPKVFVALGDLYFAQQVYELAKDNYLEALSLDANLTDARQKLATSYYWLGARELDKDLANELFTRSLNEWRQVTVADPKNANAYFQQGKIYFFSRLYKESAQALYEYSRLRPSDKLARWYLAQSLYEVGACDSAEQHLEYSAQNIDSVAKKARLLLARCYFDNKNYPKAIAAFKTAMNDTTLDASDLQRYGGSLFMTTDTAGAVAIYKQAIEKYPEETCGLMDRLGRLMLIQKNYDGAIEVFSRRLKTQACQGEDTYSKSYYFIGLSHLFMKRNDSALVYLNKACEVDSTDLQAMLYLGDAYILMADDQSGLDKYRKILVKGSTNPEQYKNVVTQASQKVCSYFLGKKEWNSLKNEATEWTKSQPDSPYAWLYLAVAYQGLGDTDNACKNYKKSLTLDPKNEAAKSNLQKLNCQ